MISYAGCHSPQLQADGGSKAPFDFLYSVLFPPTFMIIETVSFWAVAFVLVFLLASHVTHPDDPWVVLVSFSALFNDLAGISLSGRDMLTRSMVVTNLAK
jgi:hypothetical protein